VADQAPERLTERLQGIDLVEAAYIKPPAEPPMLLEDEYVPVTDEPSALTPDLPHQQGYLDAAPGGVDARYA